MFRMDQIDYYGRFSCMMDACAANCCEMSWNILVDDSTYEKYLQTGEKRFLEFVSQEKPHKIVFKQGRCNFLTDDGLCMLHKQYGPDFLCETCKNYPRFVTAYEDLYILSLSPSCPAVLDLFWKKKDKTSIDTQYFCESKEEADKKCLHLSEKLTEKIRLRDYMLQVLTNDQIRLLETRICEIEKTIRRGEEKEQKPVKISDAALHFITTFIKNYCIMNEQIKKQAAMIKETSSSDLQAKAPFFMKEYAEYQLFFEHIICYFVFESILSIKEANQKTALKFLEKIRIMTATMQYWLLLLYHFQGELTREDCNTAVYSIMRILDQGDHVTSRYIQEWNKLEGRIELLW